MSRLPLRRTRRGLFAIAVLTTTLLGAAMMTAIVQARGITALEIGLLLLFVPTFAWISVAFWNAVAGFVLRVLGRDPRTLGTHAESPGAGPLESRTAVVMPAYHEDPRRLVRGLEAMARSLARTGRGEAFDLFLLSDTTDPAAAVREEEAWLALRARLEELEGGPKLYYRRRPANTGRKAGNIHEFCTRWGGAYDFMAVLDADSVMTGPVLVALAAEMEADPELGLLQTVPLPARQETLFGRMLQLGGALYSPMLATGQAFWQGDAGNYWGHNALLRVRAFTASCGLPVLPGTPPLGGPILSHDFVEAALLRRAGWKVRLRPLTSGSWEEVPGNVVDYARRDRRWAQGSLQHLRLLAARGLHPLSRIHLFLGAMGYLASVLWLGVLLASTLYVVAPGLSARPLLPGPIPWLAPFAGLNGVVSLLGATAVLLFLPKALGLLLALADRPERWGGRVRLLVGAGLELVFSVVLAPILMMYHTAFVAQIVAGRDVRWAPQHRDGRAVGWREAWSRTAPMVGVGVLWAAGTFLVSPLFFLWLTPIFAGLVLAAPVVRWSSLATPGLQRLFVVPWEAAPPPELAPAAREEIRQGGSPGQAMGEVPTAPRSPGSGGPAPTHRPREPVGVTAGGQGPLGAPAPSSPPATDALEGEPDPVPLEVTPPEAPVSMPEQVLRPFRGRPGRGRLV